MCQSEFEEICQNPETAQDMVESAKDSEMALEENITQVCGRGEEFLDVNHRLGD